MVRLAYRYELRTALTYPLAASLAEGSFTGVVAAKFFGASQLLIAVISAAPMFGNIMALVWAELAKNRRKVPFVNMLQLGVVLSIAAAALTAYVPSRVVGAWLFALTIICARLMASGIITLRSAIWRLNYPRHLRGQIIGRITVVATAVLACATFIGSAWLDRNPRAFVYLYPGAAALGAMGIWQFARIRVRRERQILRRQQLYTPRPESLAQTDEANVLNYEPENGRGLWGFMSSARRILQRDLDFRRYQRWQFLAGFAFMMFGPSLLYMVSQEMTDKRTQYLLATVVLQIVPMFFTLLCTQLWAPLFDRMHITRFRVAQTAVAAVGQAVLLAGALLGLHVSNTAGLAVVAVGQMLIGIATAGGNLAWNLGHNDFAAAEEAGSYMAVHVMLTGLRGCIAPFVGVALYKYVTGRYLFAVSMMCSIAALVGFWKMARHAPRRMEPRTKPPRAAPSRR